MKIKAKDIEIGALVDLEGNIFADPKRQNPVFECEYQEVIEIELETPECVLIHFAGASVGFPVDHELSILIDGDE